MALWAGMCALGALIPAAARAQQPPVQEPVNEAQGDVAAPQQQDVSPTPPSDALEDLIPDAAVANPEDWAAQGVGPSPIAEPEVEDVAAAVEEQFDEPVDPAIAATLDNFEIPTFGELAPDPEVEALAQIDAPDLIDLPELEEYRISDELVLAFPKDNDRFPERTDFLDRFRALSTVEKLDSGEDTVPQLAARARADEELLIEMLRTYGYYDGEVARQVSTTGQGENIDIDMAGGNPVVRFDVLPGDRYVFGAIDLGNLGSAPDYTDLRAAFEIQPGDPLLADKIVEEELDLRLALGESGYPFAEVDAPSLLVDHEREEGDLTLPVEPGGKYVFAGVESADPRFLSDRHLSRIARFEDGDVYQASLEADLRRAILATGLVSTVSVTPREIAAPQGDQPGQVAMDVAFERAPLRTLAGAIGYGSEDGFKVEASWEHRNLFPPEGSLKLRGILGTRERVGSVTYKKNNFRGRDQVLTADLYFSDITTQAVKARTFALRGSFERVSNLLFQKPFSWRVGGEVLRTDETNIVRSGIPRPPQNYLIGSVFGSGTIDTSDDLLDPTKGFRVTGFLAPEVSRSNGTEVFYLRAQADASYYMPMGSTVLAGRVRAATVQGAEIFQVAPSRRLYGGGGGSVRGYGYQAIGPINDLGEPTGGASLVEIALEARIQTGFLDGAVEVVPFFDAGSVSIGSTPDFRFIRYGAGVGLRYKTSFGPIRVDVATPLNPGEFDAPVVVYVGLGQAF